MNVKVECQKSLEPAGIGLAAMPWGSWGRVCGKGPHSSIKVGEVVFRGQGGEINFLDSGTWTGDPAISTVRVELAKPGDVFTVTILPN